MTSRYNVLYLYIVIFHLYYFISCCSPYRSAYTFSFFLIFVHCQSQCYSNSYPAVIQYLPGHIYLVSNEQTYYNSVILKMKTSNNYIHCPLTKPMKLQCYLTIYAIYLEENTIRYVWLRTKCNDKSYLLVLQVTCISLIIRYPI